MYELKHMLQQVFKCWQLHHTVQSEQTVEGISVYVTFVLGMLLGVSFTCCSLDGVAHAVRRQRLLFRTSGVHLTRIISVGVIA